MTAVGYALSDTLVLAVRNLRRILFPLTFISSAFTPIDTLPDGLRQFAEANPFTLAVDALRALRIGDPAGNAVWGAIAWSVGLSVVFGFLSVSRYRRAVSS